jgi:hypothetical protein
MGTPTEDAHDQLDTVEHLGPLAAADAAAHTRTGIEPAGAVPIVHHQFQAI